MITHYQRSRSGVWVQTRVKLSSANKPSFYDRNWKWLDLAVIITGFCLIDFAARWVMR